MPVRPSLLTAAGVAVLLATSAAIAAPALPKPNVPPKVASAGQPPAAAKAAPVKPVVLTNYYTSFDRAVDPATDSIRAILINAGGQGAFLDKRYAPAIAEYYRQQGYAPAWTAEGKFTERALKLMARIGDAAADGLNPRDYETPPAGMGQQTPASDVAAARADVMLSLAIVSYAHDAHTGRLDPSAVSENFNYPEHAPDTVGVLAGVARAEDPAAALAADNPKRPEFVALRNKLAELRANPVVKPPMVPEAGPNLKLGMKDARIPVLRQRLNVTAEAVDPTVFDADVDAAVKAFQVSAGIKPDGVVGKGTLGLMNAVGKDHVDTIIANMERWRWMPEDLGRYYVRVNVPNYNLEIYKNDKVTYTTRIVVGQVDKQTPIFSDEIEHVIVNPVWNVPESIAVKEMLPQIMRNPGAALAGYQVFANIDGRFRPVDPYMVNWGSVNMKQIQIKQPPGEKNALGSIKFMFPNPYAVYLHDTPSKSFFQRDYRALSHGCMRVMDPWAFADALLSEDPVVNTPQLKALVGGPERQVNLTRKIPVHITYFTAWVDAAGKLQVRDDVYGHDRRVEKALGLS
jgi:murein L,D-transpeptidase YcbB/YkuD